MSELYRLSPPNFELSIVGFIATLSLGTGFFAEKVIVEHLLKHQESKKALRAVMVITPALLFLAADYYTNHTIGPRDIAPSILIGLGMYAGHSGNYEAKQIKKPKKHYPSFSKRKRPK